ncbi:MAG: lactonase family protein [SAR202 cluster bacterium]|nr:lactonase family protein [SAR202 cluster bacterium]|tara:strand:+ start:1363 stop:2427 length:1065 start_codon:yes stop_codon:yes gene_type:complete
MSNDQLAFIGTYTRLGSEGIYTLRLDGNTGELRQISVAKGLENPSFVALDSSGDHLYAVSESSSFNGAGGITSFNVNRSTGELCKINERSTGGPGPCHLMVDATDSMVIVTNYAGGSVSAHPIAEDGSVGDFTEFVQHKGSSVNPDRQDRAHAHSVNIDKSNRFAFVCDLGMDQVLTYAIDPTSARFKLLSTVDETPGHGPRHFTFHPKNQQVYVLNEIGCTITLYDLSHDGTLTPTQSVPTLPSGWQGQNTTADIHVSPDGKYVYASNRGNDSIVIFAIDQSNGSMTFVDHESTQGNTPRNFAITPDGNFLLAENQDSDTIVSFKIEDDGTLTPTGSVINIPAPVCMQLLSIE